MGVVCGRTKAGSTDSPTSPEKARPACYETVASKTNVRQIYDFQYILGQGSFGVVKMATSKANPEKKVAVKIIDKKRLKDSENMLLRELDILRSLDHPNITKFYESYQDDSFLYICMEYCAGGELLERITAKKQFSEDEAARVMERLFSAVNYLHSKGIVHRDLKLENVLFENKEGDSELKLVDFGLSAKFDLSKSLDACVGSPLYVAPEVLMGKYRESCDEWSLGVIMYILLSGHPPFYAKHRKELYYKIRNCIYTFKGPEWANISKEAKDLISKLLVRNPRKRLTCAEALQHPWLTSKHYGINTDEDVKVDPKILDQLKNFRIGSRFKGQVLNVLINQLSDNDISGLRSAFVALDTDKSGFIELEELMKAMHSAGIEVSVKEIEKLIKEISVLSDDSRAAIPYSAFLAATLDRYQHLSKDKLWGLFKYFDASNNNFITTTDLREILSRNGRQVADDELLETVREVDPNNDGKITYAEFELMMMKGETMCSIDLKD